MPSTLIHIWNTHGQSNTILESAKRLWEKMGQLKTKKDQMVRCEQLAIYLVFFDNVSDGMLDQEFTYSGMGHISQGDQRNLARVESDLADLGLRKEQCYTVSVVEAYVCFRALSA